MCITPRLFKVYGRKGRQKVEGYPRNFDYSLPYTLFSIYTSSPALTCSPASGQRPPRKRKPFPPRTVAGSAPLNNLFRPTYPRPHRGPRPGRPPKVLRAARGARHAPPDSCAWGRLAGRGFVWGKNKIDPRPPNAGSPSPVLDNPHQVRSCTPSYPIPQSLRRRRQTSADTSPLPRPWLLSGCSPPKINLHS